MSIAFSDIFGINFTHRIARLLSLRDFSRDSFESFSSDVYGESYVNFILKHKLNCFAVYSAVMRLKQIS